MERDNEEGKCERKEENIGAKGKRRLKLKEFKVGNEVVSQKCLVRV